VPLTDLLLSTSTHLSHYSTFVEGMKGLKPGETCLTAWVKTQRLAAGSFCQRGSLYLIHCPRVKVPLHLSPGVRDLKIVDIPCEL